NRHCPTMCPARPKRRLQTGPPFGIACRRRSSPPYANGCGCSSVVEHDLAKVGVEGSNPFARSNFLEVAKCDEGPLCQRAFRFPAYACSGPPILATPSQNALEFPVARNAPCEMHIEGAPRIPHGGTAKKKSPRTVQLEGNPSQYVGAAALLSTHFSLSADVIPFSRLFR